MSGARILPIPAGSVPGSVPAAAVPPDRSLRTGMAPGGPVFRWVQPEDYGRRGGPVLTRAIAQFEQARKDHPPTGDVIPREIAATAARLLDAAHQRLAAAGVTHHVDTAKGEISIAADQRSALGRFALMLKRETNETIVFNPIVLWRWRARASHNIQNGVIFASIGAVVNLKATQSERHELIHARHNYRRNTLGEYFLFDGWLMPTAGQRLYGNPNYASGFSLDELVTASDDAWAAGDALRGATAALATGTGPVSDALLERVRKAANAIAPFQDAYGGPPMARKLAEIAPAFRERLARLGAPEVSVEPLHYFYDRVGLSLHFAGSAVTVEMVEEELAHNDRSVVDVRILDPDAKCHLSLTVFDREALATVRRLVSAPGGASAPADAMAVVHRFVPARLRALTRVARAQTRALGALSRAREDLDRGVVAQSRSRMVAAGHAVEEALTRWRDTVNLDDGVEPRD